MIEVLSNRDECSACPEITSELLRFVAQDIAKMGRTRIVVKSATEQDMKASFGRIEKMRTQPAVVEETSEHEPQSHELGERCVHRRSSRRASNPILSG